jgi:SAM-dependent methyltransferase
MSDGDVVDARAHNRAAWDRQVADGNMWTRPVGREQIEAARRGELPVVLVGLTITDRSWFPESLRGLDLLCLASGGGQQGPIFAAHGASVTVFDNSPAQLSRDREVSDAYDLGIRTVLGDMAHLDEFDDESFDLVFHPVSNVFAQAVPPVWREVARVLRPGGRLLAGFMNPAVFLFDWDHWEGTGERTVQHRLPYSDLEVRSPEALAAMRERGEPLEFGHTLEQQIGGQLQAGLQLVGLQEEPRSEAEQPGPLAGYAAEYIATCAVKPG